MMFAHLDVPSGSRTLPESTTFFKAETQQIPMDMPEREFLAFDKFNDCFKCKVCGTTHFTVDAFEWHARGKRHAKNRLWKEFEDLEKDPTQARMGDPSLDVPEEVECRGSCWFKCSLCACQLYDPEAVRYHCLGRRHRDLLAKRRNNVRTSLSQESSLRPISSNASSNPNITPMIFHRNCDYTGDSTFKSVKSAICDLGQSRIVKLEDFLPPIQSMKNEVDHLTTIRSCRPVRQIPPPPKYDPRIVHRVPLCK